MLLILTVSWKILALMHNSGLPDRYRLNKVEFTRVEDYLKVRSHIFLPPKLSSH